MIDHDNKIIFVHVAKTGGSSISQFYGLTALPQCRDIVDWGNAGKINEIVYPKYNEPYSDGVHDGIDRIASHLERVHGTGVEEYHKFSTIRNPADYVRSCWNEWHTERFPSFEDFISGNWFKGVVNSQVRHHLMIGNHLAMDRLFLFDELSEAFQHVRDLLGYQDIPDIHANRKKNNYPSDTVEQWLADIINEHFWEDQNFYETLKRNK